MGQERDAPILFSVYAPISADDQTIGPLQRYSKRHLVPFGEYIPFGDWFPVLYDIAKATKTLTGGLTTGERAEVYQVGREGRLRLAPSICFESCVPHLIRRQVNELTERDEQPDVLLTQTNDGWFWGSTALDMHVVCGVFRSVETRKPLLTAANTGISAWIDGDGRIIRRAGKRKPEIIVADVTPDGRESLYVRGGDWFAGACLAICLGAGVFATGTAVRERWFLRRSGTRQSSGV
jgi:apolipoprotein N-acyltransferase